MTDDTPPPEDAPRTHTPSAGGRGAQGDGASERPRPIDAYRVGRRYEIPDDPWTRPHFGESGDPNAPPRKLSLRGAPATTVIVATLTLIELAIFFLGQIDNRGLGYNRVREDILQVFAFAPSQLIAYLHGAADVWALVPLISHAFLHAFLLHLVLNMFAFAALGPPVERRTGALNFVLLFVVAAIAGALGHTAWQYGAMLLGAPGGANLLRVGLVGASGAVCGLIGFDLRRRYEAMRRLPPEMLRVTPLRWLWNASFGFILINVALSLFGSMISGSAHLGGFVVGLVLAPLFLRRG